jgi:translation initiation factor 2 subunit 2
MNKQEIKNIQSEVSDSSENTFEEMLDVLLNKIEKKQQNVNIVLPNPILIKSGNNMIWKNIKDYLKIVKRHPDHFINFLNYELSCLINWISESKSDGCIIHLKVKNNTIVDLMKKYIREYVICKSCQSSNTKIDKDKVLRKHIFTCNDCNNNYSV